MICHILTMGIPEPLQSILENVAREEKLLLLSLPGTETAEWLLVHGKPGVVIADLELFTQSAPGLLWEIRRQSPCVIVLGHVGTSYSRRVEEETDLFLSYRTPPPILRELMAEPLSFGRTAGE